MAEAPSFKKLNDFPNILPTSGTESNTPPILSVTEFKDVVIPSNTPPTKSETLSVKGFSFAFVCVVISLLPLFPGIIPNHSNGFLKTAGNSLNLDLI